ncbi:MAG: hypothetical protein RLZZ324_1207 [Candidatus Parcubacteria bacterium]|jgi:hypothetical protein
MRTGRKCGGFSLHEALVAIVIVGVGTLVVLVFLSRKLVGDSDPVRAAQASGHEKAEVVSRKDFTAILSGCRLTDIGFAIKAEDGKGASETLTVCCPSMASGVCRILPKKR